MKQILVAAALLASMSMAENRVVAPVGGKQEPNKPEIRINLDSLRSADSALIAENRKGISESLKEQHSKDSALFANKLPEGLRAKVEKHIKEFDAKKAEFDAVKTFDSAKVAEFKGKADSLRKTWEAKRDSQITNIKDTAVRAKVQARIAEISAKREAVKAKIEARKTELEAKVTELKAKIEKMKADKPVAP